MLLRVSFSFNIEDLDRYKISKFFGREICDQELVVVILVDVFESLLGIKYYVNIFILILFNFLNIFLG